MGRPSTPGTETSEFEASSSLNVPRLSSISGSAKVEQLNQAAIRRSSSSLHLNWNKSSDGKFSPNLFKIVFFFFLKETPFSLRIKAFLFRVLKFLGLKIG